MRTPLDHARANVTDLAAAIEWSTTVLGLSIDATWLPEQPSEGRFDSDTGAVFAIQNADGVAAASTAPAPNPTATSSDSSTVWPGR